ncbi:MAG: hypothetical protein HON90_01505 [Halobacteriovoraceae bacterium]|jgi:hypothetical protein|nr:hypothetical protein [Halobacteriovoraceae bacterium]
MKIILILICFSVSQLSLAVFRSGGAGNGGDAIVCPNKVILLDSYEAEKMHLTIDLTNPKVKVQTWRSMVSTAVKRLESFDEYTASLLYDYAMEMVTDFEKLVLFPSKRGKFVSLGYDIIAAINDSEHVSTPAGCEEHPKQLVSQVVPTGRLSYRYHFDKRLWEQMSLQEQSMTILHEAWYRIMLENGAKTSVATRYINGLVASKEFELYSFQYYIEEIKATELKYYTIRNTSAAIKHTEIKLNLKEHNLVNDESSTAVCAPGLVLNPSIKETYTILNRRQKYLKNVVFQNVCFENSLLTKVILPVKVPNAKTTLRLPFYQAEFLAATDKNPTMYFHKNGKLKSFSGLRFSKFVEMFYLCDGKESYSDSQCEKGPFINKDTQITNPLKIEFNADERPINVFERSY